MRALGRYRKIDLVLIPVGCIIALVGGFLIAAAISR